MVVDAVGMVRDMVFVTGFGREGRRPGRSGQFRWVEGGGWTDHGWDFGRWKRGMSGDLYRTIRRFKVTSELDGCFHVIGILI